MLFQAVMKFLSRLVEFKILVNWGLVHFDVSSEGPWSGVTSQTPDVGPSLETSKFSLYFSASCIPIMNESLFTESNRSLITNEVNSTFLQFNSQMAVFIILLNAFLLYW